MSSASDGTGQYQPLPSSPASPAIALKAPGDDDGSVSPCRRGPLPLSPSAPSSRHNAVAASSGSSESTSGDSDDDDSSSESGDEGDDDSSDSSSDEEDSGNVPVADLRPKRPTPMDLAWRQVALDEAAGRLPPFVAETKADKIIERVGEQNKRDGEELRRIRELSATDDDAYLDAVGAYLDRRGKKRAKTAEDDSTVDDEREDHEIAAAASSKDSNLGGSGNGGGKCDSSPVIELLLSSSSSSSSSSNSGSDSDDAEDGGNNNIGSKRNAATGGMLSVEALLSSSSEDEGEDDDTLPPLGPLLRLEWRDETQLLSLAEKYYCFIVQYQATYHHATQSVVNGDRFREGDLVIISRSAHPRTGGDETITSFSSWKLPGATSSITDMSSIKPIISESSAPRRRGGQRNPSRYR